LKKEPEKEKFFTAVQIGRNAILLYGIDQPEKNAKNVNHY